MITYVDIETINGTNTYAIIDNGDGSFTSMEKSIYDTLPSNSADPVEAEKPIK